MTETIGQIDTVLDVNMDIEPQCEHSQHNTSPRHGGSGQLLVNVNRPCCNANIRKIVLCLKGFNATKFLRCTRCGTRTTRDEAWTIIEVL